MSIKYWVSKIGLPLTIVTVVVLGIGSTLKFFMAPSLLRVVLTTLICEVVFLPLAWYAILDNDEKKYVVEKMRSTFRRLHFNCNESKD